MAEMFDFEVEKRNRITIPNNSVFSLSIENEKNAPYNSSKENMEGDINMTREELDAKLAQNKAEIQAIASGMREEMAHWRETQNAKMDQISATLTAMSAKMDAKFDAVDGKIDGLKTSLTTTQWSMTIGIALVTIILSTVMIYSSSIIASAEKADTKQPQPTVIYVQQPNVAEPPQPANNSK